MLGVSIDRRLEDDVAAPARHLAPHHTLGALLVGSWTNFMLFALELILIWRYFTLFPRRQDDALWIRVLVLLMLAIDIATTADLSFLLYWVRRKSAGWPPFLADHAVCVD